MSRVTPNIVTALGYKIFLMFATINIAGMLTFSLYVSLLVPLLFILAVLLY